MPKTFYQEQLEKAANGAFASTYRMSLDDKLRPLGTSFPVTAVRKEVKKIQTYSPLKNREKVTNTCTKCKTVFTWNFCIPKRDFLAMDMCFRCRKVVSKTPAKKPCEYCGEMMIKSETQRIDRWKKKRFCDNACHNRARHARPNN